MRNNDCARSLPSLVHWTLAIPIYLSIENFVTRLCKPGFLNVVLYTNKVCVALCESALKMFVTRTNRKISSRVDLNKWTFQLNVHSQQHKLVIELFFWGCLVPPSARLFHADLMRVNTTVQVQYWCNVHNNASSVIPCIKFFDLYLKLKVQALLLLAYCLPNLQLNLQYDDEIDPRTGCWCPIV